MNYVLFIWLYQDLMEMKGKFGWQKGSPLPRFLPWGTVKQVDGGGRWSVGFLFSP
jgi:hypothetical protein